MLLLRGPAGSGKTTRVLDQFRAALREDDRAGDRFRLLVPTATMATHLRHRMAREGFIIRPDSVGTLAGFVEPWVRDLKPVPSGALALLVEKALERLSPQEFERVADYPGFRGAVAKLIQEVSAAGGDAARLRTASPAFSAVFADVEAELARRQWGLPATRLRTAAERIAGAGLGAIDRVWLDGFFTLTEPELAVVDAIRRHASVGATLPAWEGNGAARQALRTMGFEEEELRPVRATPKVSLMVAPTLDQEVEEIARRILEQARTGHRFREMAILVRTREPYVAAIRAALERFGIPARYYFGDSLASHWVVRLLAQVVEAMLGGWEHDETLAAIRMASGPAGDRFEYDVRDRLPGRGLDSLRDLTTDFGLRNLIDTFGRLEGWRTGVAQPSRWVERAKTLRALIRPPVFTDGTAYDTVEKWRAAAAALDAFDAAVEEAASALGDAEISFAEFWREAWAVVNETTLRVPDQRRDVVHVIDAYEARQWELPVVFVCGLLEKQFPQYHTQDPIIPDAMRHRLAESGLRLRTTAEWGQEERFLFELATTRAMDLLVLSYPRFNASGDENLPSFYLEQFRELKAEKSTPVRPQPVQARPVPRAPAIHDEELRQWIAEKFRVLRPTAIEQFLQCHFRFFAEQTLQLSPPPKRPEERLDPLVQGTIVHETLKEWQLATEKLGPVFARMFEKQCGRKRVPPGYRTETARREMLRNLERALPEIRLNLGWEVHSEEPFRFELEPGVEISGRIDRYDVSGDRRALVIDYKYSSETSVKQRVKEDDDSNRYVQGGLYLIAIEEALGYQPAGMLYCSLKEETTWHGWRLVIEGLEKGKAYTPEYLRKEVIDKARERSLWAVGEIRGGKIGPAGTDVRACRYCESYDLCRVESEGQLVKVEPAR